MAASVLSRYLDPDTLTRLAGRAFEPRNLVIGNLAGSHKSPLSGFAVEFAGHREYTPGDDPRRLDWRVYYNRDRYFVKQYEMETNLVCHLALDVSASMRYGDDNEQKMLYAAKMLTTIGYAIVRHGDKVSLTTFDERLRGHVRPSNSMGQIVRMTEHLDQIDPRDKTRMADCLTELAGRLDRREIVIVFSDFFTDLDQLESALQRLRYNKHEVALMHVMHHDELSFDIEGMTKFIGLEIPDELLTQPDDLRRAYLDAVERFTAELEDVCQRNRVERVPVDTRRGVADVLVDYLYHRSQIARRR